MALSRRDAAASVLTVLSVLVFAASRSSWNVWLVGSSHRWAAGAILLLGMGTCSLGSAGSKTPRHLSAVVLAVVGSLALAFAVWAVATGSATALALLVTADLALWVGSTVRHAGQPTHRTAALR
jgi:hypothetical protein